MLDEGGSIALLEGSKKPFSFIQTMGGATKVDAVTADEDEMY
jgi:hypothetical protein